MSQSYFIHKSYQNKKNKAGISKNFLIVMAFEKEHFIYDLMTFLSDFLVLYINNYNEGSIDKAASNLNVAANTIRRLIYDHKPISWGCYLDILTNLLKSESPLPESGCISISEVESFPYNFTRQCNNCRYYKFFTTCANEINKTETMEKL